MSNDISSRQNSVLQITSFHCKHISKFPEASEWERSGQGVGEGKVWLKKGGGGNSSRGQGCECLEVSRVVAITIGWAPAETQQSGHTIGIN